MKKDIAFICVSAVFLIAAIIIPEEYAMIRFIVYLAAFVIAAAEVLLNALKGIVHGNVFNENTLMIVAAIGAFCISEYNEAIFVVLFYRVGELFENYAVKKSRKSISDVMDICPDYANVIRDEKIIKVDPDEVQIGEIISVAAGEKIPLDGIVVNGSSFIDTSALTGESVPREIGENDEILSGCLNGNGVLKIRVTKSFEDSIVSRILDLVENASAKKSKSEKFITRFAKYYTPIVIGAAVLLAVIPPLLIDGATFKDYVYRALSFLVVSCPCALVISVPLSFFGGIGGAAKNGILIKGGNYLELLSKADKIVFDKTGTLTQGVFAVQKVNGESVDNDTLIELAAYAENSSLHPISLSLKEAYGKDIDISRISSCEETPGHGVCAVIDGKKVLAGNAKLMKSMNIQYKEADGGTVVYIAVDGTFAGSIIISDKIKSGSKKLMKLLANENISKTVMLTGDASKTAEVVASEIGIKKVYGDLLPADKVTKLEEIMSENGEKAKTIYVGDGINDAPVLARADVGIAMGALGSDAAIEAADVVIMNDEPTKIAAAIGIAKKTMKIAKENIIFSIAVKVLILILCMLNVVNMGVAVFGDVGVMVVAVLNSFRALTKYKEK